MKEVIIKDTKELNKICEQMCAAQLELDSINTQLAVDVNTLKAEAKEAARQPIEKLKAYEKAIKDFTDKNKGLFAKKRSLEVDFATLAFRVSSSCPLPRNKEDLANLISTIEAFNLPCVMTEKKVDREALLELNDTTLAKLGLKRNVKDSLNIKLNLEKIKA